MRRSLWKARVYCGFAIRAGVIAIALAAGIGTASAQSMPACPSPEEPPYPPYGALGDAPSVATWQEINVSGGEECLTPIAGPSGLVVALAGRFAFSGSIKEIAERIGAISATRGLVYWSITDNSWRVLISDAIAIDGVDGKARTDFTATEVLSGQTLYFTQNDTRSTGTNTYSLTVRVIGRDQLLVTIVNLTPIRVLLLTLFEPKSLVSVHAMERLGPETWGYYGLVAVRNDAGMGHERSFINRAVAFYRFLAKVPADGMPPVAP